jgi:hypothetical protein
MKSIAICFRYANTVLAFAQATGGLDVRSGYLVCRVGMFQQIISAASEEKPALQYIYSASQPEKVGLSSCKFRHLKGVLISGSGKRRFSYTRQFCICFQ